MHGVRHKYKKREHKILYLLYKILGSDIYMKKSELGQILATIPGIVSDVTFNLMGQMGDKMPRFPTVFKMVKAELKYDGIDFNKLDESDKYEIKEMARDTFDGIKEAGF